jgi:hypothetical protein
VSFGLGSFGSAFARSGFYRIVASATDTAG